MILTILIGLTLVVMAAMAGLTGWQLNLIRQGKIILTEPAVTVPLGELLQRKIDQWYYGFSFFFQQLVHYAYFYFLLALRRLVIIFRFLLVRAERKFSRLIDSLRGKGVIHKKGAVSLFLAQIKQSK